MENVDDATVTNPDDLVVDEDSEEHTVDVLANDSDADNELSIQSIDFDETKISASIVDNKIQVTTIQDVNGEFEIKYTTNTGSQETLTVTVNAVNDAPVAINSSANVLENSTNNTITLNISDVDGDDLTVLNPTALHGSVTVNSDNTLSYTPNA
ncbi:MAG: Ig-like domain-containing protein [Patescibacteria group bacterium]